MIRVVVADDHAILRAGLRHLLSTDDELLLVGEAADGAEAIEQVGRCRPDVVLMDLSMPVLDGITATRIIAAWWPDVRIVGLTAGSGADDVLAMIDAGATGYLLKDADAGELLRGIHAAAAGHAPLAATAAAVLIGDRTPTPPRGATAAGLTPREREVLALLAQGQPNRLIATSLSITESTVKAHLASIYRSLGVKNRTGAVRTWNADPRAAR